MINLRKNKKEMELMIKKIAWNTFKKTGNIDTFLELKQIENIEEEIQRVELDGNYKNEGNNNSGEQCRRL